MERQLSVGDREALRQAIRKAGDQTLPVTARSLTAAEVAGVDRILIPYGLGVFFFCFAAILLLILFDPDLRSPENLAIFTASALLIGLPLWVFLRRGARRRRDYRDPQIVVEVQEGGVILRSPGRVDELAYDGADFTFFAPVLKGRAAFLGIALESPLHTLRLDDRWFKSGSAAAAAIVSKCDDAGLFPCASRESFPG